MNNKLGKLPPKKDTRTLKLAKYLDLSKFPPIPDEIKWSTPVSNWTMMKNDEIGDCAIAGLGHIIQTWTANESKEIILSDDQIVNTYSNICGYDKNDNSTDGGCVMLDVLNYWRRNKIEGHDIEGYVSIDFRNKQEVLIALYLFGSIYIGVGLPLFAQNNDEWTYPPKIKGDETPGSWGGHAIMAVDADKDYLYIVSWGKLMKMDWAFFENYTDEAYCVFSPTLWATDNIAPNGLTVDILREDLKKF